MSQDKDDRKYYRDYNDKKTKKDNTADRDRDRDKGRSRGKSRDRNKGEKDNSTQLFSHDSSQ